MLVADESSRVGTHPANIATAVSAIRAGAVEAGRDPAAVKLAAIFHTVLVDEPARALTMARSMAAGYYEYSPALFDPPALPWTGPDPETLKHDRNIWPDFDHGPVLDASGKVVDYLPVEAGDAVSLRGAPDEVPPLLAALRASPPLRPVVCTHPDRMASTPQVTTPPA